MNLIYAWAAGVIIAIVSFRIGFRQGEKYACKAWIAMLDEKHGKAPGVEADPAGGVGDEGKEIKQD